MGELDFLIHFILNTKMFMYKIIQFAGNYYIEVIS